MTRNGDPPQFSLVTPFQNVEGYIGVFLESVSLQSLKNFEVILIDDCSSDGSRLIAEEFAKSDSRFVVLEHKSPQGPGIARNSGIRSARGSWIVFADSDDFLPKNFLESLEEVAKVTPYDAIAVGFEEFRTNPSQVESVSMSRRHNEILRKFSRVGLPIEWTVKTFPAVWTKILRRQTFLHNDIWFSNGIHEDLLWTYSVAPLFPRVDVCLTTKYLYRKRATKDSITQMTSESRLNILEQSARLRKSSTLEQCQPRIKKATALAMVSSIVGVNVDFCLANDSALAGELFRGSAMEIRDLVAWADMTIFQVLRFGLRNPRSVLAAWLIYSARWPLWTSVGKLLYFPNPGPQ